MPRYFFHVQEGDVLFEDKSGLEVPDVDAAKQWAAQDARALFRQGAVDGPLSEHWMVIATEDGETLATIPFAELLIGH